MSGESAQRHWGVDTYSSRFVAVHISPVRLVFQPGRFPVFCLGASWRFSVVCYVMLEMSSAA